MAGELILIVEDSEKNPKLERDILQFHGYRTVDAHETDRVLIWGPPTSAAKRPAEPDLEAVMLHERPAAGR
jgi:CheY-like chemotaxis protein